MQDCGQYSGGLIGTVQLFEAPCLLKGQADAVGVFYRHKTVNDMDGFAVVGYLQCLLQSFLSVAAYGTEEESQNYGEYMFHAVI